MCRKILEKVAVFIILAGFSFGEGEKNLLINGGFEKASKNPKKGCEVEGWYRNGNGTYWATDEVHSGKHSAKIMVTDLSTSSRWQQWKSDLIKVSGKIRVSAWVKTANVVQGEKPWFKAAVKFDIYDENKKSVPKMQHGHQDVCRIDGTTDWKKYTWEGELPPEVKYIRIVCSLSRTTGIVWFDDIEVVSLSSQSIEISKKKESEVEKAEKREWEILQLSPKGEKFKKKVKPEAKKTKIEIEDVVLPPYKNIRKPPFFVEIKNGNFYRGQTPVFLFGVESSGVLYPFLYKLLGIDFVCIQDTYTNSFTFHCHKEKGKWKVWWSSYPYLKTELKLLLTNGIMPYISFLEGCRGCTPTGIPFSRDFPELFAEVGHFLNYSPLNPVGERLRWNSRKSYLKDSLSYPVFAYELFNEVYYRCHDKYNLAIFRKEMEKKYKDINEANKVWGTKFSSFSEVIPPNPGHSVAFLINMPRGFSNMLYLDWMKVEEKIFGKYLEESHRKMKEIAPDSYVTVQSHCNLTLDYRDCGVYPRYKVKGEDIYGDEGGQFLFFQGKKEDLDEINYMLRSLVRYDTVRNASPNKPIISEECCLFGRGREKVGKEEVVNLAGIYKFNSAKTLSEGEKKGWNKPDYDDSDWKEIKVPGLWGTQGFPETTIGWYRKKFIVPAETKKKLKNGRRIYLQGKALTDKAYIYLNGSLIYVTKTWNEEFSLDVTRDILFGKENFLAIKIINKYFQGGFYWGGIRDYLKLVVSIPAGIQAVNPEQMRTWVWSKVIHGYGGTVFSYFSANEGSPKKWPPFSPYTMSRDAVKMIPKVKEEINSVAKIVLPRPRIKGRVALIYPFETFRVHIPKNYREVMKAPLTKNLTNYYGGILFTGVPLDIVVSEDILCGKINQYQALILANYKRVPPGIIEKLKEYLRKGGILIISPDSLSIDDEFNYSLPSYPFGSPEKISANYTEGKYGKGKFYYLKEEFDLSTLRDIFKSIFKENEILPEFKVIDSSSGNPLSFVESHSFGRKGRYVWYFLNWGHSSYASISPVKLSSPLSGKRFLIRNVETGKIIFSPSKRKYWSRREIENGIKISLPCQSPQIFIIEEASLSPTLLRNIDKKRKQILAKIWKKTSPGKYKVLIHAGYYERMSKEKIPTAVELLEKNGFGVYSLLGRIEREGITVYDGENIKKDVLENYQILVFPCPQGNLPDVPKSRYVIEKIKKFVENGGGLLLLANFYHGPHGWLSPRVINYLSSPFGIILTRKVFKDETNNELGEPLWIKFQNISPHPITSGVKTFQSAGCGVLEITDQRVKIIIKSNKTSTPPEQPVLAIREYGKGRVVVMGDGYWLEPEMLKKEDNRQLLLNIFNWLAKK